MTYVASSAPDITEGLPALFSARAASADAAAAGCLYDVVVGGIGFVFAVDSQNPYRRQSVDIQKQQIDTSTEAGEQTLDGMWVRSQTSWHYGAGAFYYEPDNRAEPVPSKYRFSDSQGVDVWTPGQLSLLPLMEAIDTATTAVSVAGCRDGGEDVWFSAFGSTLRRHAPGGDTDHLLNYAAPDYGIAVAGSKVLLGGTFGIQAAPTSGGDCASLITMSLGTVAVPYWVKSRIGVTRGAELHFFPLSGGDLDTATPHWTHPDADWSWTGMAETPDAILAAGHAGGRSVVYALVMSEDSGGTIPKLSQPLQVAELPPGEEILSIASYLGKYLGIGTNLGIRVAIIGSSGQIQYGPLIVETPNPVTHLAARDSFLYAATGPSVIRVNLETPIDDGLRFPYAHDVETPDGSTITSLGFVGVSSKVVIGAAGVGSFKAADTAKVASGWIESGAIRYATTAPKAFRTIDVVATTSDTSSVAVSAKVASSTYPLYTLSKNKAGLGISLSPAPSPLASLSYRLDLTGDSVVEDVSLRAVPVPRRQFLVQYPVQVVDRGRDAKGTPYGNTGYASTTLAALEALLSSKAVVTVKDLTRDEQYEGTIEQLDFTRVEPRARNGDGNFGGVARVTVKTL